MPSMTAHIREGNVRDHELMDRIDSMRVGGDTRTPYLRQLLWMGLGANDAIEDAEIDFDHIEDESERSKAREQFVREAVRAYVESEQLATP